MKQYTISLFSSREAAETAIDRLHSELGIDASDVSYVYRNAAGGTTEVSADSVTTTTPAEGAEQGALVGGTLGAALGIATVVGMIPVIGPIFAAGPIVTALGVGGAIGTTAAGALTGAAAGGLVGALVAWGASETVAKDYEKRVLAGDVLVAVHAEKDKNVAVLLKECGALETNTIVLA